MTRSAASAAADRLLHASPHRTVFVTTDPVRGERVVRKLVVSGSLADAERELAMGRCGAGPGVVAYLDCALDPTTQRPCLTTTFVEGTDLDRLVGEQGALPAALACRLLAPVAETLARLHAIRTATAPAGICHGDVRPKNLLATQATTLLLDFEHAAPIPSPTNGADGSPPRAMPSEFHADEPPSAAGDVFGLGATWRWLLSGGGSTALPQPAAVVALLERLLDPDPQRRPTAGAAAAALHELATRLDGDAEEAVLDAAARGVLQPPTFAAMRPALAAWVRHSRGRLRRLPQLLTIPRALPTEPAALRRELATAARVLQRFPRHRETLQWRRTLCQTAGRLLADAAAHIDTLRRSEEFAAAAEWLDDARRLAHDCLQLPGGCAIPSVPPAAATRLHRDPIGYLQQLERQLGAAREELAQQTQAILGAESRLDLAGTEQAIEAMAARHGGVSPTATRQRDQLHRLGFYLERVARAQPNVERVATLWDAVALAPLTSFVAAAVDAVQGRSRHESSTGVVGLRSLQITLVNLSEEFPHLPPVTPAYEALSQALFDLTDRAWQARDEAEALLRSVPVPVRPLQAALARLDTFRILEAFVDRPEQPRSQLQDAIESLRLRLDQARATRDRLAEGAESALARGHWTTGLFDMERAVAELNPLDEHDRAEAARLQARLADARRRRLEVDAAVRRNVELTTRYGSLQDDPSSSFADRLQALTERRDCLHLLTMNVAADRAMLYTKDLRDVETQITLEHAAMAEQQLDGTSELPARARIIRATIDEVAAAVAASGHETEAPGRLLRLLEHWRKLAAQCQQAGERVLQERAAAVRRRRRRWTVATGAMLLAIGLPLLVQSWWNPNAAAAARGGFAAALVGRAAELPTTLRPAADLLRTTALEPAAAGSFDLAAWQDRWRRNLLSFCDVAALDGAQVPAQSYAIACWDAACRALDAHLDAAGAVQFERWTDALARELAPYGVRPSPR
ncbi:MAG: hypothetical protein JNM25_02605 [Planctomycetes bacterium]|nr:hypothetical protein [Planctomycetota bacterium]